MTMKRTFLLALVVVMGDLKVVPARLAWAAPADHIVISEFATQAPDRNRDGTLEQLDQFIELYNPTSKLLDVTNWRVYHLLAGSTYWGNLIPNPAEPNPQTKMLIELSPWLRKPILIGKTTSTLEFWSTGYYVKIDTDPTHVDDRWAGSKVQIPAGRHFLLAHGTTTKGLVNYYATLDVTDPTLRRAVLNPGNVDADMYWFDKTVDVDQSDPGNLSALSPNDYANISSPPAISPLGSSLALVRPAAAGEPVFLTHGSSTYALVDMVGWGGSTSAGYEVTPAPLQTTQDVKSLQTLESVARRSEAEDSDNNGMDFAVRNARNPQNLKSPPVRPAKIETDLQVSPRVFAPQRKGSEFTYITWQAPVDHTATLKVFDLMGRLAIPLKEREPGGVETLRWDGRDTLGAIVPIGYYIVTLEVFDPQNQRVEKRETVVVIATPLKD